LPISEGQAKRENKKRGLRKFVKIGYGLYRTFWAGMDLLYPPLCGGCAKKGTRWCEDCQNSVRLIQEPICEICGLPQPSAGICAACLETPPFYEALRSWAVFEGPVRKALHRMKYHQDMGLGDTIAAEILTFVEDLNWHIDLVLPVPLGRKRLRERGYNQVGLFARPLTLAMGWKYAPRYLKRARETASQVGLSAGERILNVHNAFVANKSKIVGKSVLVVDDVSTTGATLNSCAEALRRGGAKAVYALSVARALPKHGLQTV